MGSEMCIRDSSNVLKRVARWGNGWIPIGVNPEDIKRAKVTLSELCENEERNPDDIQITIHSLPSDKDIVDMFEDVEVDRVLIRVTSLTSEAIFDELETIASIVLV